MGISKNFIVRRGLEVKENLLYADPDTNRVGINTIFPTVDLDVLGDFGATNVIAKEELTLEGLLSAGGSVGEQGQYLISTGTGVAWQDIPSNRTTQTSHATVGQTSFSVSYIPGLLDVFINGVKLSNDEYTADNGVTVVLDEPCFGGETVEFISYSAYNVAGVSTFGITVQSNGNILGTPNLITSLNFIGVAATSTGVGVTITIDNPWESNGTGIVTTSNVGIGTTTASSALTVTGDANITGIVTATGGFISVGSTTPIQISLVDNQLTFTAVGIGSTTLLLF